MKREISPFNGTWPDPDKIRCKDCKYRDKTEVKLGNRTVKVGITRSTCKQYPDIKPHNILFLNHDCTFYQKEVT